MKSYLRIAVIVIISIAALFAVVHFASNDLVSSIAGDASSAPAGGVSTSTTELVGARAPFFDLRNLAGDSIKLSDYDNKPLVVVFWSTWNADAANQVKILDDYLASLAPDQRLVSVLAIDSQEDHSIVSAFMRRGGYQVPLALDTQGAVSGEYKVTGLPTFFFIDRDGVVQGVYAGQLNQKALVDKIEAIVQ
jgi:peroxiredoxin